LSQLLDLERVAVVGDAVRKLPGREQDCLKASLVDNLSYKEIGERLGVSVHSVRRYIARALANCHKALAAEEID